MDEVNRVPNFENHSFLSELLLQPNSNKTDSGRSNMFSSSISQTLELNSPEKPFVFTRFENQVGKYSSAYKKIEEDCVLISILKRTKLNKILILQGEETGEIFHVDIPKVKHITENYGYTIIDTSSSFAEGDVIPKGTVLYKSASYDDEMNLQYGRNIRVAFIPWKGMTYEDAMVISKSAARESSHTSVKEIYVTINTNDILLNLLGDSEVFKAFADIGEQVSNKILCARRRLSYESLLVELADNALTSYKTSDDVFKADGVISNIEVFCNNPEHLSKYKYNEQLFKYYNEQVDFDEKIIEIMDEIKEAGVPYDPDLAYLYSRSLHSRNDQIDWTYNKSKFDIAVIKFTVFKNNPIVIGSKLANRYGNKGTISLIEDDENMPVDDYGNRVDLILNPLGVNNRLNYSQLYEHEINHLTEQVILDSASLPEMDRLKTYLKVIEDFNPTQGEFFKKRIVKLSTEQKLELLKDIEESKCIPIHQPPFFDNISFNNFRKNCKKYEFRRRQLTGVFKPQVVGFMYMLKLKHEPYSKFSARSAKQISMKGIPIKNNLDYKSSKNLYSHTPVRLGEQEAVNLLTLNQPKETFRFLSIVSSNKEDRQNAITALLTAKDIHKIEKIEVSDEDSKTASVAKAYLGGIGVKLIPSDED